MPSVPLSAAHPLEHIATPHSDALRLEILDCPSSCSLNKISLRRELIVFHCAHQWNGFNDAILLTVATDGVWLGRQSHSPQFPLGMVSCFSPDHRARIVHNTFQSPR